MVTIFETFREHYRSGSRVISKPEKSRKFLIHFNPSFSTIILTLNAYYSLQIKEYTIIRLFLIKLINIKTIKILINKH